MRKFHTNISKPTERGYCIKVPLSSYDLILVRKEPLNTRLYQRVSNNRVNEIKLLQKDIRTYQRVSTVLENLCGFCAVGEFITLYNIGNGNFSKIT